MGRRMNIETLNSHLRAARIVPVIALERAENAVPLGHALQKSGIPIAETTFRSAARATPRRTSSSAQEPC